MIDNIRNNVNAEIGMLREIANYSRVLFFTSRQEERKLLIDAINALISSMKIVNESIPILLKEISIAQKLPSKKKIEKKPLEEVKYKIIGTEFKVVIPKRTKAKLLKELSISEKYVKQLKKRKVAEIEKYEEFKAARGYLKLSNKLFLNISEKLINKGYFKRLPIYLRKANIDILFQAYVAMLLTSVLFSFFFGIFLTIFLLFFKVGFSAPFVEFYSGNYLLRALELIWIPIICPIATFLAIYYYPITEKSTLAKRIDRELPFAVIHMSAISGSGIQPSEIFRIIGLSKEYKYLRKEIRKILNQINLYGYDLVTAINNVSKSTPSTKLSELLSGLSTTINSGGSLPEFFEKRAETLLIDYRLEREKYSKTSETFMDIYITVVIAAPMILMLMLVIMSIANFSVGFTTNQISFLIVSVIALINVVFLIFLHISQPNY